LDSAWITGKTEVENTRDWTTWFGTRDSRDEQQGFNAIRVQGNWVQLRIRWSSRVHHAVSKSAVVLPQFRMAYNLVSRQ
jgi:hypothetical protein